MCSSINHYLLSLLFFQVCSSFAVTSWIAPQPRSTGSMCSSVGETTIPTTLKDTHAQNTLTTLLTTWVSTPPLLGCSSVLTWLIIFTGKRSVQWMLVMRKLASCADVLINRHKLFCGKIIAWRAKFWTLVTYMYQVPRGRRVRDGRRSYGLSRTPLGRKDRVTSPLCTSRYS